MKCRAPKNPKKIAARAKDHVRKRRAGKTVPASIAEARTKIVHRKWLG